MTTSGQAEGEEERGETEAPPEPAARAGSGPAAEQRAEDLPGQGDEERHTQSDGHADAIGNAPGVSLQESEVGAASTAPVPRPLDLGVTHRAYHRTSPLP